MKYKKSATSEPLYYLIALVIIAFVIWFSVNLTKAQVADKGGKDLSNIIDDSADPDKDGISNYYDQCDCLIGDRENEGCPYDKPTVGTEAEAREKECKDSKAVA